MMSRPILRISQVALLWLPIATSIAAQDNPATKSPAQTAQTVTIVGCLVQGLATEPNSTDFFVRTPTVAVPPGSTIAVGKPGTTSTATSSGTPTADSFYRVDGLDRERLRPHIGHRIELQGQLSQGAADTSSSAEAKTRVDATGRATTTVETRPLVAGSLRATTIKMLSASCP